jgi:hypothetical protein
MDCMENITSNISSIAVCLLWPLLSNDRCLHSHYLATAVL